jgi:hypothetical protein
VTRFTTTALTIALITPSISSRAADQPAEPAPVSTPTVVASSTTTEFAVVPSTTTAVRAIHLTAWAAGSKKYRKKLDDVLKRTILNAVIIDVKEFEGEVYVPGVSAAEKIGAYTPAMPDIAEWVADLKKRGIYTVARIVVFKDNIAPRKNKALAVKNPQGEIWLDRKQITWLDPYNPDSWRYNIVIAAQAARLGFDEVQFDYIRFPTDGALSQMRFSKPYNKNDASHALVTFLAQAHQVLKPLGVKISIDVFGLTTTVNSGMGIGQLIGPMAAQVDYVCPMVYPSHYAHGEYGIPIPNNEPYKVISIAMRDAIRHIGPEATTKLRPYLQDFSLKSAGISYHAKEIRAQIQALMDLGIHSWSLWNARASYTWSALETPFIAKPAPATIPVVQPSTFTVEVSSPTK